MNATLTLNFSDNSQAADFFAALSDAYRKIAGNVKAAVAALDLPAAGSEGRAGVAAPYAPSDAERPAQTTTAVPDAGAPARKRRTKAEMEAARAAEGSAASTPIEDAIADNPAEAVVVTDEDLRKAGNALVQSKGGPVVAQILGEFAIRKYPDCPNDKRAALLKRLTDAAA